MAVGRWVTVGVPRSVAIQDVDGSSPHILLLLHPRNAFTAPLQENLPEKSVKRFKDVKGCDEAIGELQVGLEGEQLCQEECLLEELPAVVGSGRLAAVSAPG